MTTDLFGQPVGGHPEHHLNLHQKRQATLLYHWMSVDYLKGLLSMVEALIRGADVDLEFARRQGRDALLTNTRWGVRDTSANWSTHVFPALQEFRKSILQDLAQRANESYEFTGTNQCGRMISEFSSMWMTPEEEKRFDQQWDSIDIYASKIDYAAGIGGYRRLDDSAMVDCWRESADRFPRIPKFRVRTDVQAESGRKPPRTGVYVAQDDPHAVLQFAWTGNADGVLGPAVTFNALGLRLLAEVGREALWIDDSRLIPFAIREMERDPTLKTPMSDLAAVRAEPLRAMCVMAAAAFTERPCKWFFVEKIDGEFDDEPLSGREAETTAAVMRCEAGHPCPREGYWLTPAMAGSRRHVRQGELMPSLGGDYGVTIWQWDSRQEA